MSLRSDANLCTNVTAPHCPPGMPTSRARRRNDEKTALTRTMRTSNPRKHAFHGAQYLHPRRHSGGINVEGLKSSSQNISAETATFVLPFYRLFKIPTLRGYIHVSHRERRITLHTRNAEGQWTTRVAISGGRVSVESLDVALVVDQIYRTSTIR